MGTKTYKDTALKQQKSFHSINVPSEWGPSVNELAIKKFNSFHSINVPSEWGQLEIEMEQQAATRAVSIQLMSPASGDLKILM